MAIQDANYISVFFSLLKSGLYGKPLQKSEQPESIDWKEVIILAKKHAVLGLIIDSVQYLPESLRPSSSLSAKMKKFALRLIHANLVLDQTVARLVTFLKQHGINGVLLKGQGVARCYRVPQMRQTGDIDFYIGKTIYKKAVALCKEKLIEDKNACDENEQHFDFTMGGIPIELHRLASKIYSPFKRKRFQNWIVDELEHSSSRRILTIGNADVTVPSLDFDAIYIFYHAWRHYIMGGIGLRQLCDWAMIFYAHGDDIDKERLKDNIIRFGITKGWMLFAGIAVNHLGVPKDKIPLYDPAYNEKSEKVLEEIITGGNFGRYTKANLSTPNQIYGLRYGLCKLRNITQYFISIFPLIPLEATFLFFHRLVHGTIDCTKRTVRKWKN